MIFNFIVIMNTNTPHIIHLQTVLHSGFWIHGCVVRDCPQPHHMCVCNWICKIQNWLYMNTVEYGFENSQWETNVPETWFVWSILQHSALLLRYYSSLDHELFYMFCSSFYILARYSERHLLNTIRLNMDNLSENFIWSNKMFTHDEEIASHFK